METFKIRDMRKKEKYFVDDEYLNGYAKLCGIYATGVYISLCRHANKEQTCFPSIRLIAQELRIAEKSVRNSLKKLVYWNIIKITTGRRRKGGVYAPNHYALLDRSEWKQKPEVYHTDGTPRQEPEVSQDTNQRHSVPHKDTQGKDTQKKDTAEASSAEIVSILKAFESINPTCSTYYGNTTQRKACRFLIDTYGFDRVKLVIGSTLPKSNNLAFFPSINTPLQLQEKWSALESAIKKYQNKAQTEKEKVGQVYW